MAPPPAPEGGVEGLLARCRFPEPTSGPVALAVSGGADSLALLVLAARAGLGGTVYHVDHGLRPGSASEVAPVRAAARAYGFAFEARKVTLAPGPNLEARARRARYRALPPGVLTGHTMDDQAETVLLNLLRGGALDGLAGMRAGRTCVERPLLGLRRHETEWVCAGAGLVALADPTNADPAFRRNRVRREVLPLLCEVAARDVVPVLARQAALAADDAELLDRLAGELDATDVRALRAAPAALARRSLRLWIRSLRPGPDRHPPSAADVARIMEVVHGRARACQVGGGGSVARRAGRLSFEEGRP